MLLYNSLIFSLYLAVQPFDWVSFSMVQKINKEGKTSTSSATVFFANNSDLVVHYDSPMDIYVINNKEGEMKLYNPAENSVFYRMNYQMSSESNQFYYFLMGRTDDMGLREIGFSLSGSRLEDGLLISTYLAPPNVRKYFWEVELVHKGKNPIFIGYKGEKGNYIKKVFYYSYETIGSIDFPKSITEISYISKKDSIISKTYFDSFQLNNPADREFIEFEVPSNARLIE